jgi:hypothetical protein
MSYDLDLSTTHAHDLGMDPDVGRFRPAEAETGLRVELERDVELERLPADSPGDWRDAETGDTYDAVGNFDGKFFDTQWDNLKMQIERHLLKADFVPVDVSKFTPTQRLIVEEYIQSLNNPQIFTIGNS